MQDRRESFFSLFDQLSTDQQEDLIQLMKTWISMPAATKAVPAGEKPVDALAQHPELSQEWHCLTALKKVVEDFYPPRVELAYIAFHPHLDSVQTAKTREAARQMFVLEAAYEMKAIFEKDPDSDVLDQEIIETLERHLHNFGDQK
jgi:hypothetical protein